MRSSLSGKLLLLLLLLFFNLLISNPSENPMQDFSSFFSFICTQKQIFINTVAHSRLSLLRDQNMDFKKWFYYYYYSNTIIM